MRGATPQSSETCSSRCISIHAPLAGCDKERCRKLSFCTYFNPRTPCGVRPTSAALISQSRLFQSTHPLRGATLFLPHFSAWERFQSTHPLRGATTFFSVVYIIGKFQSTHPLRGATYFNCLEFEAERFQSTHPLRGATFRLCSTRFPKTISIHAPLAGCDISGSRPRDAIDISIHAPLAGCDEVYKPQRIASQEISIHAPLAGCDKTLTTAAQGTRHFNPRTPCGVRQQNCRNIPGKFAQKLQNFCKAEQRAALPRVGQRESGRYFRPCAVRTSRGKPERFRFASDNERALRSVARLCAEVLDAGFILVSKVIKA